MSEPLEGSFVSYPLESWVELWELAEGTLLSLREFSTVLESFSLNAADYIGSDLFFDPFSKLIDGIDLFTQGISSVKKVLKAGIPKSIELLEKDLLSALQKLLDSHEQQDTIALEEVLRDQIPRNLKQWRELGVPSLIRAKDC